MNEPLWLIDGTMAKAERDAIVAALEASEYHLTAAAARLRIGRSTLYRLIATYQISVETTDRDKPVRRRGRQGRPVRNRGDAAAPDAVATDGPRIIQVDGAWYLLNPTDVPVDKA